jgi:hypothetical protein
MPHARYSSEQIVELGEAIYAQKLHDQLEPRQNGKFLALDVETGDYEIDEDKLAAIDRARSKRRDAPLYILRVGYPTAVKLGGRFGSVGQ